MNLPITHFGPPKKEKLIERYFLVKAKYKTTKKHNAGDGTSRYMRDALNKDLEYCNFTVVEITDAKKLSEIKLLHKNKKVIK